MEDSQSIILDTTKTWTISVGRLKSKRNVTCLSCQPMELCIPHDLYSVMAPLWTSGLITYRSNEQFRFAVFSTARKDVPNFYLSHNWIYTSIHEKPKTIMEMDNATSRFTTHFN